MSDIRPNPVITTMPPVVTVTTPPPPPVNPIVYAGGSLVTGFLGPALKIIEPSWTDQQAMVIATCIVMAVAGAHVLAQWYLSWRYPSIPPLPTILK